MEESIIINLQNSGNAFFDVFFQGFSYLASWIGAICLFLVIIIFVNKKFGLTFGIGFLGTIGINYLIKIIVNRPRPFEANPEIINKLTTIGKSFPSGHMVSATFMMFCLIFLFNYLYQKGKFKLFSKKWFKIFSYIFAIVFVIITAISRMYLGQHYLTDILVGVIIGFLGYLLTYFVYKRVEKSKHK